MGWGRAPRQCRAHDGRVARIERRVGRETEALAIKRVGELLVDAGVEGEPGRGVGDVVDPLRIDLKGDLHETVELAVQSVTEHRGESDLRRALRVPYRELNRLEELVV